MFDTTYVCCIRVSASTRDITQLTVQLHSASMRLCRRRCSRRRQRRRLQWCFLLLVSLTFQMFFVCLYATFTQYCITSPINKLHILHLLLQTQTLHILTNQSNHLTFSSHYLRITGNFPSMSVCPYFMSISRCTRVYEHAKFWILFNGCSGFLIANLM